MEERISHEPLGGCERLGVNYPWFVGSNVFVPALLAGSAVLYKPSEFAAMTGLESRLLHAAGIPEGVFTAVIGDGKVGGALVAQPSTACSSRARSPPASIAAAVIGRLVKLHQPAARTRSTSAGVDIAKAATGIADGAFYNTGQSCSVERITCTSASSRPSSRLVSEVRRFRRGDPADDSTYIGPLTRAAAGCGAW